MLHRRNSGPVLTRNAWRSFFTFNFHLSSFNFAHLKLPSPGGGFFYFSTMRRTEFEVTDPALWQDVIRSSHWGTLSLVDPAGWPYAIPMNHVWTGESLVLHGSVAGKRGQCLAHEARAQFTVVKELSLIPSDVFGSDQACGAAQFFQSVMMWGNLRPVADLQEKAELLQTMMRELQPRGGHAPINVDDSRYATAVRNTGVWVLHPEQVSAKFKLGQNLPDDKALALAKFLERRGEAGDLLTAQWIRSLRG